MLNRFQLARLPHFKILAEYYLMFHDRRGPYTAIREKRAPKLTGDKLVTLILDARDGKPDGIIDR